MLWCTYFRSWCRCFQSRHLFCCFPNRFFFQFFFIFFSIGFFFLLFLVHWIGVFVLLFIIITIFTHFSTCFYCCSTYSKHIPSPFLHFIPKLFYAYWNTIMFVLWGLLVSSYKSSISLILGSSSCTCEDGNWTFLSSIGFVGGCTLSRFYFPPSSSLTINLILLYFLEEYSLEATSVSIGVSFLYLSVTLKLNPSSFFLLLGSFSSLALCINGWSSFDALTWKLVGRSCPFFGSWSCWYCEC